MNKVAAVVKSIDNMEIVTYITLEINNIEIKNHQTQSASMA